MWPYPLPLKLTLWSTEWVRFVRIGKLRTQPILEYYGNMICRPTNPPTLLGRHPASGYVQGINDLVTPFLAVFLSEHFPSDQSMDTWDLSDLPEEKVLEVMRST